MNHELKIYPEYYKQILLGLKKVEIRLNDRNYQEGDLLIFNEFDPKTEKYTSFQVKRNQEIIIRDVAGLDPDYVIMQISKPL